MKIFLIQTSVCDQQPETNCSSLEGVIRANPGADLYILPEMFTTGFLPQGPQDRCAQAKSSHALEWLQRVAGQSGAALTGSVALTDNGKNYNRMYFVFPSGEFVYYDKRHLFSYAGENLNYTAGENRVVVCWKQWRFLLQICYDLRFPVFSRNLGDYDAAIYVASWPASRIEVWDTLLKARAIENQAYVIGVNRIGNDLTTAYCGHSAVYDFKGRAQTPIGQEATVLKTTLDKEALLAFRQKFPALQDADIFNCTFAPWQAIYK